MMGGTHLLLLAVFFLLARCQQKPKVSMSPTLTQIFSGDLFYLTCLTSGSSVTWYFNGMGQNLTDKTWKIAAASPMQSGSYQCESNGQKSDDISINVLAYMPRASLTINTGQPVMRTGGSVVLQLDHDDGLREWRCWVYRGAQTKKIKIKTTNDSVSLDFQPRKLEVLETIFWCTNLSKQHRSNQVTVRTSDKAVALEIYPPPVVGGSLTLRCLVWGTDRITRTVFYKDNALLLESDKPIHEMSNVTESGNGRYKCDATFTHKAYKAGPPYQVVSDDQDVFVQVATMRAVLSGNVGLTCSCSLCPSDASYHWYYNDDGGQPLLLTDYSQGFMMPKERGAYACRAVWDNGRSYLSNIAFYQPPIKTFLIIVVIVLVILAATITGSCILYKKRTATGPTYEDVPLRVYDGQYETLQKARAAGEGEYHTLRPGEERRKEKKEGEYEHLKKEDMKDGVYHTLGMVGAAGGAGDYQPLKKEGLTEGVYNTLEMVGAAGGAGDYQPLKKEGLTEGVAEGVYHTLGM